MKPWQHFKTITRHRLLVMVNCFRIGLIRQGLTHDLSKYSPTEFWTGAKYYQGIRSPNAAEREKRVILPPGCITRAGTGITTSTGQI